jgi:hypothetical protein
MPDQGKLGRARMTVALGLSFAALPGIAAAGFYDVAPADLAGPAGKLIRVEPMHIYPAGSKGYRILYTSTLASPSRNGSFDRPGRNERAACVLSGGFSYSYGVKIRNGSPK